eukprot:10503551-Lingulodinium_polyedra.AAC.1
MSQQARLQQACVTRAGRACQHTEIGKQHHGRLRLRQRGSWPASSSRAWLGMPAGLEDSADAESSETDGGVPD